MYFGVKNHDNLRIYDIFNDIKIILRLSFLIWDKNNHMRLKSDSY